MVKLKRTIALLLSFILVFSMAGCGKKKKETVKVTKEKVIETIAEAIALGENYSSGVYDFKFAIEFNNGTDNGKFETNINGAVDGGDSTIGANINLGVNSKDYKFDLSDFVTTYNDYVYLNIDKAVKAVSGVDTEFGYYKIPAPKTVDGLYTGLQGILYNLLVSTFADTKLSHEGDTYTLVLDDPEEYESVIRNLISYISENRNIIKDEAYDSMNSVEYEKYIDEIVKYSKEDIVAAATALGYLISEDNVEDIAEELKKISISELDEDFLGEFDEIKKQLDAMDSKEFVEKFKDVDVVTELSVTSTKDKFNIVFKTEIELEGQKISLDAEFMIDPNAECKISEPPKVSKLLDMAEYLMGEEQLIQDIIFGTFSILGLPGDNEKPDGYGDGDTEPENPNPDNPTPTPTPAVTDESKIATYEISASGSTVSMKYDSSVLTYAMGNETSVQMVLNDDDSSYAYLSVYPNYSYKDLTTYYSEEYGELTKASKGDYTISYIYIADYDLYYVFAYTKSLQNDVIFATVSIDKSQYDIVTIVDAMFK